MPDSFVTPGTVTHQAPLSMGFSRQEYWSGLPCPPPRDLPIPGIEPASLMSPALAGSFFTTSATWEASTAPHIRHSSNNGHLRTCARASSPQQRHGNFLGSLLQRGHGNNQHWWVSVRGAPSHSYSRETVYCKWSLISDAKGTL